MPCHSRWRRVVRVVAAAVVGAVLLTAGASSAGSPGSAQPVWAADGPVYGIAVSGSTAYIGGAFTHLGPSGSFAVGSFVPLDASSGEARGGSANVDGTVYASAPDGAGGWYLGGSFWRVAATSRFKLAHVRADGTLDPAWAPTTDGTVTSIAVSGSTVYVGGSFSVVNGSVTRHGLAALDRATGSVLGFDPNVGGMVSSLALSNGALYLGGSFTSVNGSVARNGVAAVDATSGNVLPFDPDVTFTGGAAQVEALAVSGTTLYLGGYLTTVNGSTARAGFAAVDANTGAVLPVDPRIVGRGGASAVVASIVASSSAVYIGGEFSALDAGASPRNNLAAFDPATGHATAFDPDVLGGAYGGIVEALALSADGNVYAGGDFSVVGAGVSRHDIAELDPVTGATRGFAPTLNAGSGGANVATIGVNGSMVFAGGDFVSAGGVERNHLAAIDLTGGAPTSFDPDVDNVVDALVISGATLYAGGSFSTVNGSTTRHRLAAFNAGTGSATSFDPNIADVSGSVEALAVLGQTVYAGGSFSTVNGVVARHNLAAFDAANGAVTSFDAGLDGNWVLSLAAAGSTVYAGGDFSTANGGVTRHGVAGFDGTTGAATPFDPEPNGVAEALAVSGPTLYAGGDFTTIGGAPRNRIAALDTATGALQPFDPDVNGDVLAIVPDGQTIFAGGSFTTVNGSVSRDHAASFDSTGAALAWDPRIGPPFVSALGLGATRLIAGGYFGSGASATPNLALFDTAPGAPTAVSAVGGDSSATVSFSSPADSGAARVSSYTATSAPGGIVATGSSSPIIVRGLADGTAYTFRVTATNALGTGPASAASNTVVPTAPAGGGGGSGGGGGGGGGSIPDLSASWSASTTNAAPDQQVDFTVTVRNSGGAGSLQTHLKISLPVGAELAGPPLYESGSGCSGTTQIDCYLDYVPNGGSTHIRFEARFPERGVQTLTATASADRDANPADNSASVAIDVAAASAASIPTTSSAPASPRAGMKTQGTAGANHLIGTARDDVLRGLGGNDILRGLAGNDVLYGGAGNDVIFGGTGHDSIYGGSGNDRIYAADGARDRVDCGSGRDVVYVDKLDTVAGNCERVIRR